MVWAYCTLQKVEEVEFPDGPGVRLTFHHPKWGVSSDFELLGGIELLEKAKQKVGQKVKVICYPSHHPPSYRTPDLEPF